MLEPRGSCRHYGQAKDRNPDLIGHPCGFNSSTYTAWFDFNVRLSRDLTLAFYSLCEKLNQDCLGLPSRLQLQVWKKFLKLYRVPESAHGPGSNFGHSLTGPKWMALTRLTIDIWIWKSFWPKSLFKTDWQKCSLTKNAITHSPWLSTPFNFGQTASALKCHKLDWSG